MRRRSKYLLIGVIILVMGVAGGGFWYWQHLQQAFTAKIYTPSNAKDDSAIKQHKPFSVLLLGTDTGADGRIDKGNSDTIMVVTINPETTKTTICSIPRDTMAQLVGAKPTNVQKLNAAYNMGGSQMAKASVSKLLNVPIDYYATLNMGGLKKLVDAVGGVDVNAPMKVSFDHITITKGHHHLNGKQALTYTRMRHEDPRGDYGRQLRQQEVMRDVLKKLTTSTSLTRQQVILDALQHNLRTDLSFPNLVKLGTTYRANTKHIHTMQLVETPAWINYSSYQIASTAKLQKTSDALRTQLGLSHAKLSNLETKLNAANTSYNGTTNLNYQTKGYDRIVYSDSTY